LRVVHHVIIRRIIQQTLICFRDFLKHCRLVLCSLVKSHSTHCADALQVMAFCHLSQSAKVYITNSEEKKRRVQVTFCMARRSEFMLEKIAMLNEGFMRVANNRPA
jgi:hypothetical protein